MNQNVSLQNPESANTATRASNNRGACEERARRLYSAPGGPLLGWLFDEARARGHKQDELSQHLGVTVGYLHQLRSGQKLSRNIGHDFAAACARYLQVPPIVVKLVSGQIRMSDFGWPNVSEADMVERAFARLRNDPVVMTALPGDLDTLNFEARRALVMLYSEFSCQDLFSLKQIPEAVQWLQRAATLHDESEAEAVNGHRDICH